jgi:mono/diheme cytochrome c family protein
MISLLSCALVSLSLGAAPPDAPAPKGDQVFAAKKCALCHSVDGAKIKSTRPAAEGAAEEEKVIDLSGLAARRKADWLVRYLRKEEKIGDRAHPPKFKGEAAELDALVQWLLSVKAPAPSAQ